MAASYVSARFEVADLWSTIKKQRCILRSLDDGPVPPVPTLSYFPTEPDLLRDFVLIEYVNDVVGERLVRVANINDINTYLVRRLKVFEDPTADFLAAGVQSGDTLQIYLAQPSEWTSEEYPDSLLRFTVASVIDATHIELFVPFPSFKAALNWEIPERSLIRAGTGITRRETLPVPLSWFLDRRVNMLFNSVPEMDSFIAASKASIDALAAASTSSLMTSENYTSRY
jgi:hypothetical protein